MATAILSVLHAAQAAFSAYTLYLSSISIRNLQTYEETSKKAAKYSNVAETQLHKTRTTQASGALTVLASFLSSLFLTVYPKEFGSLIGAGFTVANLAALEMGRRHVGAFWKGKAKVPLPGVGDYNEAISKTQEVKLNMGYLVASWGVMLVLGFVL